MRILMLTQWFDPEPDFKGLLFAKELVKRGHTVEVLTGFPNYPEGKVYPGYRVKPWQRETIDGVQINRVFLYPSHDGSGARRIANYLSFAFATAALGALLVHKPDVIYVFNLITLGWTARLLRTRYGCPIVYDVQDLWPESVLSSGMMRSGSLGRVLRNWCDRTYRSADRITVLSPGFKHALAARGVDEKRITVIYNWCDENSIHPEPRDEVLAQRLGLAGHFNVMFAGTMGVYQGLDTVLDAASLCKAELPNVQFVFVGGGVEKSRLETRAKDLALTNVRFLPRQQVSEMGKILPLADALLVHLKDNPLFHITIPSKTQAYLFMGIPLLMGVRGDAAELVSRSGAGITCEPENPQALITAIRQLVSMTPEERQHMGVIGQRFYTEHLSINAGVERFLQVFDACLSTRKK